MAARAVLNPDAVAGGRDDRLARRFFENHGKLFKIDRRDGNVWVESRPVAFHLTPGKRRAKAIDGAGTAVDRGGPPGENADEPAGVGGTARRSTRRTGRGTVRSC